MYLADKSTSLQTPHHLEPLNSIIEVAETVETPSSLLTAIFSIFRFQISILFGRSVSAYSSAVGLSAISFFASSPPSQKKDAAPIPNAVGRILEI